MKLHSLLILPCVTVIVLAGCGKREEPAPSKPKQGSTLTDAANQGSQQVVDAAREVGQQVGEAAKHAEKQIGEAVKQASQEVTAATKTALSDATSSVTAKYQEVVAKAQSLLKEARYEEALNSLKSLGGMALSAEQQQTASALQTQIQAAWEASKKAGSTATEAVKGLFK